MTSIEQIKIADAISKGLCISSRLKKCQVPEGTTVEILNSKNFSLSIWKSLDGETVFHSIDWTDGKIHFAFNWYTIINEPFTSLEFFSAEIIQKLKEAK